VKRLVEESIQKTRNLSHELSPTLARTAGLVEALSWLARNLEEQLGLKVELAAETIPDPENPSLKTFLYRAAHELLFNTFKHAQVETARVSISKKDDRLTVSDHGKGFDPALTASSDTSTGLGLLSIRERARFFRGNLEIESEPDQGSRFVLTVPVA
jgi:signal transduction histidine kinase